MLETSGLIDAFILSSRLNFVSAKKAQLPSNTCNIDLCCAEKRDVLSPFHSCVNFWKRESVIIRFYDAFNFIVNQLSLMLPNQSVLSYTCCTLVIYVRVTILNAMKQTKPDFFMSFNFKFLKRKDSAPYLILHNLTVDICQICTQVRLALFE